MTWKDGMVGVGGEREAYEAGIYVYLQLIHIYCISEAKITIICQCKKIEKKKMTIRLVVKSNKEEDFHEKMSGMGYWTQNNNN